MKLRNLSFVSLLALVACAGQTYRANVGPMFVRARGDIGLQNVNNNVPFGNSNNLDSDLGLGDVEVAPYVRLQTDIERHRIRLHGFLFESDGTGTLAGDFGGIPAGSQVNTSMDMFSIVANWGYQLVRTEHLRLALGVEAGFYGLDVAARSNLGREEVETSVIVPMPFAEVELLTGPLTVGANGGIMGGDFGDGSGRYVDIEAYATLQADEHWDVTAGYRYILLDAYGRASGRDFDADIDLQGLFISAGVTF